MNLPKVIINNYLDYLNGKEVEATVVSEKGQIKKGMHVLGFHNSIAINTGLPVPHEKQSHYIGVEGMVTDIDGGLPEQHNRPQVKIRKL